MASPISRRPGGLLDLLLTQQQGQNPTQLLNEVAPVIDMAAFYEQERLTISSNGTAWAAVNAKVEITVPATQAWKLVAASAECSFATNAQAIGFSLKLGIGIDTVGIADFARVASTAAADDVRKGILFPQPLIIASGNKVILECTSLALDGQPNITGILRVMFVLMNV